MCALLGIDQPFQSLGGLDPSFCPQNVDCFSLCLLHTPINYVEMKSNLQQSRLAPYETGHWTTTKPISHRNYSDHCFFTQWIGTRETQLGLKAHKSHSQTVPRRPKGENPQSSGLSLQELGFRKHMPPTVGHCPARVPSRRCAIIRPMTWGERAPLLQAVS